MSEEQRIRRMLHFVWALRWTRNRLGDSAMIVPAFCVLFLMGFGEGAPPGAVLIVVTLEFFSRVIFEKILRCLERPTSDAQATRRLRSLCRLLRREVHYQNKTLWLVEVVHPPILLGFVVLGLLALNILPPRVGLFAFVALATYCLITLGIAEIKRLLGRWSYASAVMRFSRRFRPPQF